MKAMILGAGKGTRMQPLTFDTPKPLIPLLGRPVMESIICHLESQGVKEIIVNTAYLGDAIESYFQSGHRFGVDMAYSYEGYKDADGLHGQALGSAGGISKIHQKSGFFNETFIVLCGDALVDIDLKAALDFHKKRKSMATVILKEVDKKEVEKYGVVALSEKGRIEQFQEKPAPADAMSNLANVGIYLFEPEILDFIPTGTSYDIGADLLPLLARENQAIYGYRSDFNWVDIGNLTDYLKATKNAIEGETGVIPKPGKQLKKDVYCGINTRVKCTDRDIRGNVVIGSGTVIEQGVELIGPLQIGSNCYIESGAVISGSIIHDYTHIKSAARIDNKIIYKDYCIDHTGNYWSLSQANLEWLISDNRSASTDHELGSLLAQQRDRQNNVVYADFHH